MPPLHIAALGSSFASGPGIAPETPPARRSYYNYPSLISRSLSAKLSDLSSSGATLLNVLNEPQDYATGESAPPQLEALSKVEGVEGIDLVMLTAGGNDIGMSKAMIGDAAKVVLKGDEDFLEVFLEMLGLAPGGQDARADFTEVEKRFVAIIDRVHALAPKAKILLVEYISVLGPQTKVADDQPLDSKQIRHYRKMADDLAGAYARAAEQRKEFVEVVSMKGVSDGHALGGSEPWVTGCTEKMVKSVGVPYHPNAAGHVGVAKVVEERVRKALEL
nr:hypothetical protein B0A51_09537 [Rachicladosporium sp. CCFEE 5018]